MIKKIIRPCGKLITKVPDFSLTLTRNLYFPWLYPKFSWHWKINCSPWLFPDHGNREIWWVAIKDTLYYRQEMKSWQISNRGELLKITPAVTDRKSQMYPLAHEWTIKHSCLLLESMVPLMLFVGLITKISKIQQIQIECLMV